MSLSTPEATFLGTVLEGFFYGVYCIIFALYLGVRKKDGRNDKLRYPITALFILCTAFFPLDFSQQLLTIFRGGEEQIVPWNLNIVTSIIYSLVDVISQGVLIYRCWVMWNHRVFMIILPSTLALTSMATSLSLAAELTFLRTGTQHIPTWFFPIGIASFSLSLGVNTIVTSLLVLKLILVHREVTSAFPAITRRRNNLLPVISILIESGMFMFIGQLIWVVLFGLQNPGFNSVGTPITMIYGITPTLVIVRVAMKRSDGNNRTKQESTLRIAHPIGLTTLSSVEQRTTEGTRVQQGTDDFKVENIDKGIRSKYYGRARDNFP